jgi:hypothetical protein
MEYSLKLSETITDGQAVGDIMILLAFQACRLKTIP